MDRNQTPVTAILLMLLAMFCIAVNDAIGKHLTQRYSIWQVLWVRSWVWIAFAISWISWHGGLRRAWRSSIPLLQGVRSLLLVVEVAAFILAFRYLPLGDVSAIGAATPLVVLAFTVAFLGERVGWHRWTAQWPSGCSSCSGKQSFRATCSWHLPWRAVGWTTR